ncbi:STM3941 family protein [Roseovarius sp. 2305UL8-3]|uniref:STM3941 family protein n=1 Tax=Roseovarius conchicola TaxID=3121636 RepID=UPI0035273316
MTTQPFEIHAPRLRTLLLAGVGVAMTALSVLPLWLAWQGEVESFVMLPIGLVGILFFGTATVTALFRLLSPKPVLRVDAAGIHVWRYPLLRWEEFAYADAAASAREVFLVLHTVDDDAYRARMVWYRRLWARGNAALIDGAVYLSQRLLPGTAMDLAERINSARKAIV